MENLNVIIQGCIDGDPKYQRMVYDGYRSYALKIVFRYIYRYEKAEDVVTDGFMKAFNHFNGFKKESDENLEKVLMGWLKRIMINCAIDELRKDNMLPEIGGIPDDVWDITDKSDNADVLLLYKELISQVKQLPPNYRIIFNLHVVDGYSHSEIAHMMNISTSTSRSGLARAKTILQGRINKTEQYKYAAYRS
ncbi:MAG TPA: RNA polymerase sigma factor [Chitinophagaceae bacterium]